MIEFGAASLGNYMFYLGQYQAISALAIGDPNINDATTADFRTVLEGLRLHSMIFELGASMAAAERAIKAIDGGERSRAEIEKIAEDLHGRLRDELSAIRFLHISSNRQEFYEAKQLFGKVVAERFPDAISDIEQAGKCFAFGRHTACVFHLMRVMEVGLNGLKQDLGITQWHSTWNAAIAQIRSALKPQLAKKSTAAERRRKEFIESATGYVQSVSFAWRNATMHRVERSYDGDEALDVFNAVKAFMRYLAKDLKPARKKRS
jgi:hypothetical protein